MNPPDNFRIARNNFEKAFIKQALVKYHWNQTKTAKALGIHRNTLILKIQKYRIFESCMILLFFFFLLT
jgi:DNA-binding NtrC family response regulator